nr:MAG TPA: minor capsid component [Caudoviricetes sp.]
MEHKIDPDLFTDSCTALNEAVDRAVKLSVKWGKPDKGFIRELKRNNAVFAAFKAHREQNDLAGLLVDDDGNARSFDSFRRAAAPVIGEYNVNWLQTEYATAVRVARTAVRFKQYEKDGDLYPNAEWLPSRAAEPRMSHRKYYHTVRRLTDPWWETHYPGCVWGCQCDMRNTDRPVTHIGDNPAAPGAEPTTVPPSEEAGVRSPGLSRNPARSGELFSRDHPYFTSAYPGAEKAVAKKMQTIDVKQARKEVQEWAKREVVSKSFLNQEIGKEIEVTSTGIKEALNQPHKYIREKNEAIRNIKQIIHEAHRVLYRPDDKGNQMVVGYHYLEFELAGEKSYIVIRETKDGRLMFYSVVDKIKGR